MQNKEGGVNLSINYEQSPGGSKGCRNVQSGRVPKLYNLHAGHSGRNVWGMKGGRATVCARNYEKLGHPSCKFYSRSMKNTTVTHVTSVIEPSAPETCCARHTASRRSL